MKKVAITHEFSGTVRDAFIARGHDAISCDYLPSRRPGPHHQGDAIQFLRDRRGEFDLIISHPPCTYLCSSGLHWNKRRPERAVKTEEAIQHVRDIVEMAMGTDYVIENPIGCLSSQWRKPDQIIQPWQFGHPESKATCFWTSGLPKLVPTNVLHRPAWIRCECCHDFVCTIHEMHVADCKCRGIDAWAKRGINPYLDGGRWDNQTPSGQNKLGPSADRWAERSITYQGIADAMAEQWGVS